MKKYSIGMSFALMTFSLACGQAPGNRPMTEAPTLPAKSSGQSLLYQAPERGQEFLTAVATYGPLYIREGEFDAESATKPWSSWWYPLKETTLFQGTSSQLSTLEKYDRYMDKSRNIKTTHAALYEKTVLYDPDADSWEGLCDAWALASLMEPEPTHPITYDGVTFGVGDLKALITKSYEIPEGLKQYGQRYNGDSSSVYEDIYPDQLHRVLQAELFDKHKPFIMDKDPGIPVWNTPVWKAFIRIVADSNPNVMHVTTWLVGADPHVNDYDFVGTKEVDFEYTYDLFGNKQADGRFLVSFGKWTERSVTDHPDFVTAIPDKMNNRSRNVEISTDEVQRILHPAPTLTEGK